LRSRRELAHDARVPSDSEAISALIMTYAERIDAGDLDGVAALFAHATWRVPARAEPFSGSAAVRRVYDAVILYDGTPCTRHVVTNLVVELRGDDEAVARSSFTVFQALPDFPLQPIIAGRYHDAFERVDGRWRFADRLILSDLIGDLSRHLRM
jgi:3-phenylpropionate/cinnamic acid dioxygenase small subunit